MRPALVAGLLLCVEVLNAATQVAIAPRPAALAERIEAALAAKGPHYRPRTEHLSADGSPHYTNRLILEDSPYLLQHGHNPVDWYPWGREAFDKAKREGKPIFLSIGYSTCHWCHVMERESFEAPAIAEFLNRHFVPVKVDRERRPDVDSTYMTAVMLIAGRGGWPMSSFLTPDGKTFFGGTYYPPAQFIDLLRRVERLWREQRADLIGQADRIAEAVAALSASRARAKKLDEGIIEEAVADILSRHDELQGGFSQAPKFPNEPLLYLLLDHAERTGAEAAKEALENTLDAMARGGIYDQIGGGFHRYSIDNEWLVPHFEKMLYNQAHLARVYLLAWRLMPNPSFQRVVRQTLDYVLREMTAPEGGFYSATDADSEGEEGLFFLWTPEQIETVLDPGDAQLAVDLYQVSDLGNFEGRNILNLSRSLEDYAAERGLAPIDFVTRVTDINRRLLEKRRQRVPPLRDDKIVTAWNGMMITALAQAGDLLPEPQYLKAATRAAEYLLRHHRADNGRLWRASLEGRTSVAASQEDYAYLAEGLLMLFDVTGERRWLERAREVTDSMLSQFWDPSGGGFYMSAEDTALSAMGRLKDSGDGAIPSGNSVALHVLQKLHRRTDNPAYEQHAHSTLTAFSASVARSPTAFAYLLKGASDLFHGELGPRQFAARGAVAVHARLDDAQMLTLDLSMRPGWHINAHEPLQENLIPTRLSLPAGNEAWRLDRIQYPPARVRKLGFQPEPLALYEGDIRVSAAVSMADAQAAAEQPFWVELRVQACSDEVCLAPETLRLRP